MALIVDCILDPSAYGFGNARVSSLDLSPLHAAEELWVEIV